MSCDECDQKGFIAIFRAMEYNITLRWLSFHIKRFRITLETTQMILDSVQYNDTLKLFNYSSDNTIHGTDALESIETVIEQKNRLAPKSIARRRHDEYFWLLRDWEL